MENMDKGLTVPKWLLIVCPKIPQMPQILYAQFVCPSPKVLDFSEKRLHWASVLRGSNPASESNYICLLYQWFIILVNGAEDIGTGRSTKIPN